MDKNELEARTKAFALKIIRFNSEMPNGRETSVIRYQLLKSGTSVGANYREANRAESRKDFIHKISIVEKEAAETLYWLELCKEANIEDKQDCIELLDECDELVAIFTSIGRTTKQGKK